MARPRILNSAVMSAALSVNGVMVEGEGRDLADRRVPSPAGEDLFERLAILSEMERTDGLLRHPRRLPDPKGRPPGLEERSHPCMELVVGRAERVVFAEPDGLSPDEGTRIDALVDVVE